MLAISLTSEEMEVLKDAKRNMDWSGCTSSKLLFVYSKFIATPAGRIDQVKEIANRCKALREERDGVEGIFAREKMEVESPTSKPDEVWVDSLHNKKIDAHYVPTKDRKGGTVSKMAN